MEAGRWVTHLGFERGNAIVEAQQRYVGRPWSGWSRMVVQQLPQMPPPSINYIDSSHEWVSGRGEPGATVKLHVHIPGVIAQWVQVDGTGQWNLSLYKLINDNTQIEIFQAKGGYLNSQKAVYFIHKNSQSRYYPNLGRVE